MLGDRGGRDDPGHLWDIAAPRIVQQCRERPIAHGGLVQRRARRGGLVLLEVTTDIAAIIVEAIERVNGVMGDIPLDAFEADWQKQWLVERGVEIITLPSTGQPT